MRMGAILKGISMVFFHGRHRSLRKAGGFTLIELLVVVSILGVLAAVVVLNVVGFMNKGTVEAKAVELRHVHSAAGFYLLEGNHIASATTVGPGNKGIVAPWLTGDLKYYWTIDTDGSVYPILFASVLTSLDGLTSLTGGWIAGPGGLTAGGIESSLVATNGNWDDFTFETTATFTPDDGYGMFYRSDSDASSGYVLQFDPVLNELVVRKIVDGIESAPIASVDMPAGFSGQHSISVSVSGSSHTVSVDGSAVMTFSDGTYGSGTVGLQSAAGSNANFTGFTVSPP
jgi:prepilin-type N-terminal cleavage/methylation domain-containing protein